MLARLRSLAAMLLRRDRFEREMRDEVRFHIDARAEDLMREGLNRDEATRRARVEFGAIEAIKDDCREARGVRWFDEVSGDLRYAFRLMVKTPGFTAAAVLSLALGIGANTAIFSLMDAVMMRTLPVRDPHELVFIGHGKGDRPGFSSNYPLFDQFRKIPDIFAGITAYSPTAFKLSTPNGLENATGLWVNGSFHSVIGVPMALGRGFGSESDQPTANPTAVISDAFWSRYFGRDPSVLDKTLTLDGRTVTIVGVTAPEFTGLTPGANPDITMPIAVRAIREPGYLTMHDTWTDLTIVARIAPGVSISQALAPVEVTLQQYMSADENSWIKKMNPDAFVNAALVSAARGSGRLRLQYETALKVLMGMVGIVLLIASVNVANLLLVRSAARAKEVAIRLCVGGGRSRLIRQFLTETLLLALLGGALSSVIAIWGAAAIMRLFNAGEAQLLLDVSPNGRIFAFTVLVSLVTGVACGLVPAFRSTKVDLTPALKDATVSPSMRRWTMAHLLVGSQVALSIVVLLVAALLVRTLVNLRTLDAGFTRGNLLLITVDTSGTNLKLENRLPLYTQILDRLRAAPGVIAVSGSKSTPIHTSGDARSLVMPPEVPNTVEARAAFSNPVTPGYFDTLGINRLKGRLLTDLDTRGSLHVAVVNETMAKFVAGDGDPLGMTFAFQSDPKNPLTIVGVVEDTHQMNLREPPPRGVFEPMAQTQSVPSYFQIEIRTADDPAALAGSIRQLIRGVSADLLVRYVRTMEQQIDASLVRERMLAMLSGAFALLALTLVVIGLYGVMSYSVTRRSREIGIRMALGAARARVLRQVLAQTMIIAVAGAIAGVIGAALTTRTLSSFLYGVSERDPMTLSLVVGLLLTISTAAGLLPARRAATLDPVRAIKVE